MEDNTNKTSVLMLPWLAHGHISPFFELAKKLADRNFHVYICSTPILLQSIKKRITPKHTDFITLVPFHIPPSPELPLHHHTTNGLPPHLMITLKNEYEKASPQFADILTEFRPDLLIYDFNQFWAAEMAVTRGIPAVQFLTGSVSLLGFTWFMINNPGKEYPHPEIKLRGYELRKYQSMRKDHADLMIKEIEVMSKSTNKSCEIVLVKSCREIENKYFDIVSDCLGKKIVPVGQLVEDYSSSTDEQSEIIEWLGKKSEKSVVFASFGSEYFLTEEERHEIAKGLESSGMNFIWVIRLNEEEKMSVQEALPQGFLERIKDIGMVVEGWAPQARILNHSSTGGFLSHCGWSSVMESMKFGVPIVALPMQIDQPLNARLVEAIGVGVEVVRDEEGKLVSEEITKAIRKVMIDESGEEVRDKMKELSHKLNTKNDEEIDVLVEEINNLCKNFNYH